MRYCTSCGARFSNDDVQFCPNDGSATQPMAEAGEVRDPLLGRVVDGRYRIEEKIGEGGMGMVYLATHAVLGKRFALKVLHGEMAKDPEVVQRFIQEAQAATSIGHENIIDISDFGRLADGAVYFVMELLEGEALTDMIGKGGALPTQDALRIVRGIASALGAAHARGIVHRDLKPDNVFLVRRHANPYFVKVLDFGIAKVGGAASKLTKTGMVFGTPHYMSPEQAAGQSVDHRTDIYALGVIMYEMFTGKVPFDAETFMGILSKHMFEDPVPPSEVTDAGARLGAIEDLILKCLAKKPEQRYHSMDELIADLDTIRGGGSVRIGRPDSVAPPGNLADSLEPPTRTEMRLSSSGSLPSARSKRAALLVAAGLGAVVAVMGAVALVLAMTGGEDPDLEIVPTRPVATAMLDAGPPPPRDAALPEGVRTVEIVSEPRGAQVLVAGAIIGNTPVEVPLPEQGERTVEIRQRGYETQRVMLTLDSPGRIEVALEEKAPERRAATGTRPSARERETMRTETTSTVAQTPTEAPAMTTTMRASSSEVVDPWAD